MEKLPLFAVGGVFAVITYVSQRSTAVVTWPGRGNLLYVPLVLCHNVIFYLGKLLLPLNLSPHYEPPSVIGFANPAFAASMIACVLLVLLLVLLFRHAPGPLVGSIIFFVMLLPAIGLIKVTQPLVANRYVYLPSLGILLVLAWLLVQLRFVLQRRWLRPSYLGVPLVILVLATLGAVRTRQYLHPWTNTGELHQYMLRLFPDAPMVHNNLGLYLASHGRYQEAIEHFRAARPHRAESLAGPPQPRPGAGPDRRRHGRNGAALSQSHRIGARRHGGSYQPGLGICHRGDFDGGLAVLREAAEVEQRLRLSARSLRSWLSVGSSWTNQGGTCLPPRDSQREPTVPLGEQRDWHGSWQPIRRKHFATRARPSCWPSGRDPSHGARMSRYSTFWRQHTPPKAGMTRPWSIAKEAVGVSTRLGDSDSTKRIEKRLRLYEAHRPYRSDPQAQLEEFTSETQRMFDDPQTRLESLLHKGMAATLCH